MQKLTVLLAIGIFLAFPASVSADEIAKSKPAFLDLSQLQKVENGAPTKGWLIPARLDSSDPHCNGKSVQDFLNGKCNKLHGFDMPLNKPDRKGLPPAFGQDGSTRLRTDGEFGWQQSPFFEFTPKNHGEFKLDGTPLDDGVPISPEEFGLPDVKPKAK
ncbi:MAG TPA: hypothetical protein PKZ32_12020 [Candidatus Melainabacteria bacterium]|nr:hypothetical protein [Candidatus Melainabacteria bacterium]